MHRFFVAADALSSPEICLEGEVLRHLTVLRLHSGDEIELLDGTGRVAHCRLTGFSRHEARVERLSCRQETESVLPLRLMQGLPKGEKFDWLLEKGVELGVSAFSPVLTSRCIVRGGKEERWRKVIDEAARQSRRTILPALDPVQHLEPALAATTESLRLLLWEEADLPLNSILPREAPADVALLVGPEGGVSAEEAALAVQAGFVPVSLGRRILRTETAGLAVAAVLQNRYGDFGSGR